MILLRTTLFALFGFAFACLVCSLWKILLVLIIAIVYRREPKTDKDNNTN